MKALRFFTVSLIVVGLLSGLLLLINVAPVHAANCTWTGAISNNWSDASNWSGCIGVPDSDDYVTINSGTAILDNGDVIVLGLTQAGGTITGTYALTVTDTFTWTGEIKAAAGRQPSPPAPAWC